MALEIKKIFNFHFYLAVNNNKSENYSLITAQRLIHVIEILFLQI